MKYIQKQWKDCSLNIDLLHKVPFIVFIFEVQIPSCIDLWAMYHFCIGFWAMALHGLWNRLYPPVLWWTLVRHWSMCLQSLWEDRPQGKETQSLELQQPLIPFILGPHNWNASRTQEVVGVMVSSTWLCIQTQEAFVSQEAHAWGRDPESSSFSFPIYQQRPIF